MLSGSVQRGYQSCYNSSNTGIKLDYMTYSEKLKDPRWQKKRLKILDRDNFKCRSCGDNKSTLHVHHISYSNNPWDAEDGELVTLCTDCHKVWHSMYDIGEFDPSVFSLVTKLYDDIEHNNICEFMERKERNK